jgi:hypothetical protein
MNIVEQNIVKFVDSLIVDDFSTAHKFLENVINQKIKITISEAAKVNPFKKTKEDKKKGFKPFKKKSRDEKKEKAAADKSAFGKGKFPKAKSKSKSKKKLVKEGLTESSLIDLHDYIPDGSDAASGLFDLEHYHGGQTSHMYGVRSSGKIRIEDISGLKSEIGKAIKIANQQGEIEHAENFKALYRELGKLEQRFEDQIERGSMEHLDVPPNIPEDF